MTETKKLVRVTSPQWVPVDIPPIGDRRVPFLCAIEGEENEINEALHFGWYTRPEDLGEEDDRTLAWYCEICGGWFGDVARWFDLPLPEEDSKL